jgi:hypothetical protein
MAIQVIGWNAHYLFSLKGVYLPTVPMIRKANAIVSSTKCLPIGRRSGRFPRCNTIIDPHAKREIAVQIGKLLDWRHSPKDFLCGFAPWRKTLLKISTLK